MTFEEFKRVWIAHFAGDVSAKEIEQFVLPHGGMSNYLWHVFSWRLLPEEEYWEGDAARQAFDAADKSDAVLVENWYAENPDCVPLSDQFRTAAAMEDLIEVYVVGKDFGWTYIQTHEGDCGPYFCVRRTHSAENYDKAVQIHPVIQQLREAQWRDASRREMRKKKREKCLLWGIGIGVAVVVAAVFQMLESE